MHKKKLDERLALKKLRQITARPFVVLKGDDEIDDFDTYEEAEHFILNQSLDGRWLPIYTIENRG